MALCLKNIAIHKVDGSVLISNFSLEVANGEIMTLMGPSGCGKSTLLDVIAGHLASDFQYSGEVEIDDQAIDSLPAHQRGVGILFQDDLLFPHLNVWENLAFALPENVQGDDRKQQALTALSNLSLSDLANAYPEQISGGQRARISLIRMLLAKPKVALLDEPFSKLDKELRVQFRQWVVEQLLRENIPTLLVTHDKDDVPAGSPVFNWPKEGVVHAR